MNSREQFEAWVQAYHGVKAEDFPSANMIEMFWQAWQAGARNQFVHTAIANGCGSILSKPEEA